VLECDLVMSNSDARNVVVRFRHLGESLREITTRSPRRDLDKATFANLHGNPKALKVAKGVRLNSADIASSELWKLSMLSFAIHGKETDLTLIEVNPEPRSSIQEHFKFIYFRTYEIWKSLWPANLLFVGADVIARRPFGFPDSKDFRMFGRANVAGKHIARKAGVGGITQSFDTYFNADVRYFPHTMTERSWQVGFEWAQSWEDYWEYEQDMYNAMAKVGQYDFDDRWGWQMPSNEPMSVKNDWNNNAMDEAFLVHLHSTRDTAWSIDTAKLLLNGWPNHLESS
jgi:hypothetical protein